eukprot:m.51866 g.51866  ORF g.51866 m.51866 type:complete len:696 (+) comp34166_c0_seq4:886-2973(+)
MLQRLLALKPLLRPPSRLRSIFRFPPFRRPPTPETANGDFRWLEDAQNPAVSTYLHQENAFAKSVMRETKRFQRDIKKEQRKWIRDLNLEKLPSATSLGDNFEYFVDTPSNSSFPIFLRKHLKSKEKEILLDTNDFHTDHIQVQCFKISPDEKYLAYAVDLTGKDHCVGHVIDLATKHTIFRESNVLSMEWASDSQTLFYGKQDIRMRASQVWKHRLMHFQDELVYSEEDDEFFVHVTKTLDGCFILVNSNTRRTSEVHIIDANSPDSKPVCLSQRQNGVEWYLEHRNDWFYLLSNLQPDAEYNLVRVPAQSVLCGRDLDYEPVLPFVGDGVLLEDMYMFQSYCVLYERYRNQPRVSLYHFDSETLSCLSPLPSDISVIEPDGVEPFNSKAFAFHVSSPIRPWTKFTVDTHDMSLTASNGNLMDYKLVREEVTAKDGSKIPLTIISPQAKPPNQPGPCLAYAYGAYGTNLDTTFDSSRLSLLKRGWTLAFCHIRGGGELGRAWYNQGRGKAKINTFLDLECCIEFIHEAGYSNPGLTAVRGSSAGGVAAGWLCNNRPDLIRAAVLDVPFVDVATVMADRGLPLSSLELSEWSGELEDTEAHCPYGNLKTMPYPAMLVSTAFSDTRVPFWGPTKFVAKFRHLNKCASSWDEFRDGTSNMIVLRSDFRGNHHARGDEEDQLDWLSFECVFLCKALEN